MKNTQPQHYNIYFIELHNKHIRFRFLLLFAHSSLPTVIISAYHANSWSTYTHTLKHFLQMKNKQKENDKEKKSYQELEQKKNIRM